MSHKPIIPVDPGSYGMLAPSNPSKPDSVINSKYDPSADSKEDSTDWIPSTYLWAFDSAGIQIARAVTHMRDSIECFLRIHKANPQVAIITSKPMNLLDAVETVLWKREGE